MQQYYYLIAIVLVVVIVVCLLMKMVSMAIAIAGILLVTSIVFSVFWGDGEKYVQFVAEYLPQDKGYALLDWYSDYRAAEDSDPIIDADKIIQDVEGLRDDLKDGITDAFS